MVNFSAILPNQLGYTLISEDISLRFIHTIGKGAYGVVYLAWDTTSGQDTPKFYAVKCTLKYEEHTEFAELQEREILFHSSMSWNRNVTTLHHVITEEHYVYFVMDYQEGGDLFGAIVERKHFERNDAAVKAAFVQILDAVQACHDMGLSHRDLKPENVLCSHRDSRFYLADFGLATQTGLSNSFGCGSGHYMSPECLGSAYPDPIPYSTRRSDIWSLGVILVNILTGRNPWQLASLTRDEGYAQYVRGRAKYFASVLAISREAAELLSRILDPSPRTRISLADLRVAVLEVGTFFPTPSHAPDYVRIADESFRASLEHTIVGSAEEDDGEPIIDVPLAPHHAASPRSGFTSVPLASPPSHGPISAFVNEGCPLSSSLTGSCETDETLPPSTPISPTTYVPATYIPAVVPALALAAELENIEAKEEHRSMIPRNVRRFVGAVRRVALRA